MKTGSYLLDTNIIVDVLRGRGDVLRGVGGEARFHICTVTIGELFYGALKSGKPNHNQQQVATIIERLEAIGQNEDTARAYSQIKNNLRLKGTPIPENDIWIAAIALQYDLILVTNDSHFQRVVEMGVEVMRY